MWSHNILNWNTEILEPCWLDLGEPKKEKNAEKFKEKSERQLE